MPKEHLEVIEEVFEEFGVIEWIVEQPGTKHPRVRFLMPNGKWLKFTLPSSPSDRRGMLCSRTMLRRYCRRNA